MSFIKVLSYCRGKRSFLLQKWSTGTVSLRKLRRIRLRVAQTKVPQALSYVERGKRQYHRQDPGLEEGYF